MQIFNFVFCMIELTWMWLLAYAIWRWDLLGSNLSLKIHTNLLSEFIH